jgi:hypothetical protein
MAFLRFTRDKRGYEHFSLVQPTTNRRGKVRTRILYWFRTPPNVKVGREPFDEPMRRALEAQNPDITFDWQRIVETPIPSADTEKWRERRRLERAERAARQADEDEAVSVPEPPEMASVEGPSTPEDLVEEDGEVQPVVEPQVAQIQVQPAQPGDRTRRRRRRRGRRGRPAGAAPEPSEPGQPVEAPGSPEPRDPEEPQ